MCERHSYIHIYIYMSVYKFIYIYVYAYTPGMGTFGIPELAPTFSLDLATHVRRYDE